MMHARNKKRLLLVIPYFLCALFFIAYSTLSIVKHNHYNTGYDLGINDQVVWRYSIFQAPISTIGPYPDKIKLYTHIELVYALISPVYWIWSNPLTLLIVQAAFLCAGGIAVFLLAKRKKLSYIVSITVLLCYLGFYGVQFAVWNDVHSASFATAFIAWFIYFLDQKKKWGTSILFLLAITAKENVALLTLVISFVYFIKRKDKMTGFLVLSSIAYVVFIFYIYFPYILQFRYLYQNEGGLLSNFDFRYLFSTKEKIEAQFYTLLSFGFLPILNPVTLLPVVADFATYFVIGSDLPGAQGLFGHYRVTLAPLMAWATIISINKFKVFDNKYTATYLILCTMAAQYTLHLPLSYLTKTWFWQEPAGVKNIRTVEREYLPKNASVVTQVNIIPHLSQRDKIYTLYPEKKQFIEKVSSCGENECNWFRWHDNPEYLLIDTSEEWDARHLLANREEFIDGINNLERVKVITVYKRVGDTVLYKINVNPFQYWVYPLITD